VGELVPDVDVPEVVPYVGVELVEEVDPDDIPVVDPDVDPEDVPEVVPEVDPCVPVFELVPEVPVPEVDP
jgi:hypothetical protein